MDTMRKEQRWEGAGHMLGFKCNWGSRYVKVVLFFNPLKVVVKDKAGKTHHRCSINIIHEVNTLKLGCSHITEALNVW